MNYSITQEAEPDLIHWATKQLRETYLGSSLRESEIASAIKASLCFWMFDRDENIPVGFARVVTDKHVFSSITDLLIIESHRRKSYGSALMKHVMAHQDVRATICILTSAHAAAFYPRFGFALVATPVLARYPWAQPD